jgi:hypothetical protein
MTFFTSIPFICFIIVGIGIAIYIYSSKEKDDNINIFNSIFFGFVSSGILNFFFWLITLYFLMSIYEEHTQKSIKYDLVSFITKSYYYSEGSLGGAFGFFVGSYKEGSTPYYYYYMKTIDGIKYCKDRMDDDRVFLNETEDGSAYVEQTWGKRSPPEWLINFFGFPNNPRNFKLKTVICFPRGTIKREFDTSLGNL